MHNGGGSAIEPAIAVPLTPTEARTARTIAALAAAGVKGGADDTIMVDAPPGHDNFNSKEEKKEDLPIPTYLDLSLTNEEKLAAVEQWSFNRKKHKKKKRAKSSFVSYSVIGNISLLVQLQY